MVRQAPGPLAAHAPVPPAPQVWSVRRVNSEGEAVKPVAVSTLSSHADEVYALDWAPNGEAVASGSKDRLVKM